MKKYLVFALVVLLIGALATGALARGKSGKAGKSNIAHLYLFEKDGEPDWNIVEGGAWGKMKYNLSGEEFKFVFNGHGLEPEEDYCLIYYPDPWPGDGLICLGSGTANVEGNVHIMGSEDTGDLPIERDENDGAKIWLVVSAHVDCEDETWATPWEWEFARYLFEFELITFEAD